MQTTNRAYDELLPKAAEVAVEMERVSVGILQRKLYVGYGRAGRLLDELAARGIVGEGEGAKPRNVLTTREQMRLLPDE